MKDISRVLLLVVDEIDAEGVGNWELEFCESGDLVYELDYCREFMKIVV